MHSVGQKHIALPLCSASRRVASQPIRSEESQQLASQSVPHLVFTSLMASSGPSTPTLLWKRHNMGLRELKRASLPPAVLSTLHRGNVGVSSCITAWFGRWTALICNTSPRHAVIQPRKWRIASLTQTVWPCSIEQHQDTLQSSAAAYYQKPWAHLGNSCAHCYAAH